MTIPADLVAHHRLEAGTAAQLYSASLVAVDARKDWYVARREARRAVARTLRQTDFLFSVGHALSESGRHVTVLRHLLAPPQSQDQFRLLCPEYSKTAEKSGRPLAVRDAEAVAAAFALWRDRSVTRWLDRGSRPTASEAKLVLRTIPSLLATQSVATLRRGRLSAQQESAVVELLERKGWARTRSALIQNLADVPARHFMHKTRFATRTSAQEVDIACGLGGTVVLAMECKVTNDETNSVKRVNDVLKKARAWQLHWGSFVRTAALLQGVVAYKDVVRLLDDGVQVFWSHNLADFEAWLDAEVRG